MSSDTQHIYFINSNTDTNDQIAKKVKVLLPALRQDMAAIPPPIAADNDSTTRPLHSRNLLTCCVRISPEKKRHRVVDIVEHLMKIMMTMTAEEE